MYEKGSSKRRNGVLLLLLIPFVALLWPPFYARLSPHLWGIPFFVWYQFAWVVGGSVVTVFVYRVQGEGRRP